MTFWGDCLLAAVYLINRTPTPVLQGKCPYEILFNSPPQYEHLRVFGSLCYATIVPKPADKFAPRAVKGVFLGYPYSTKGYKVVDLETKQVLISRDVQFVENVFPFHTIHTTPPQQLFFSSTAYIYDDPLDVPQSVFESGESSNSQTVSDTNISSEHLLPTTTVSSNVLPTTHPQRTRHLPVKLLDYTGLPTHLVNSFSHLSIEPILEPQTFKEAIGVPEWCEAMHLELAALEANQTWDVVPLPSHKKTVGCKWLYKVKYHGDGSIDHYKARLVAKGFTQTHNMDYFKTFAPVAKMTSFRLLLAIAAMHNWPLTQLDVTNAFLHGLLDKEVYMACPPGYSIPSHILKQFPNKKLVCRLLKSLYGLKQAPRQWFIALSSALLSFGFVQTCGDPSLFVFSKEMFTYTS